MSVPSPPYPAPNPKKPRPRGRWFWVAGLFIVAALVVGTIGVVLAVKQFIPERTRVDDDGVPVAVDVEAGQEYAIWSDTDGSGSSCDVLNPETGRIIPQSGLGANISLNQWEVDTVFTATDEVAVACEPDSGPVEVGPKPNSALIFGGLFGGIGLGVLLFAIGGIWMLVLIIKFFTGDPRTPLTGAR